MGIQDTENTWHVVFCTEVMLYLRMSTLPLLLSRQRDLFNLSTGVQPVSRWESTINPQPSYPVAILQRFNVLFACCLTLPPLLKLGLVLKRITKRLELIPLMLKEVMKVMSIKGFAQM